MSIAFSCECGKKFLAKEEHAGKHNRHAILLRIAHSYGDPPP
jgi:hypothetical protein